MKLEVGMYAYSKSCRDYGIGKIVDITESGLGFKGDLVDIQYRHSKHAIENNDVIAGFDIIDLIEVGDYVNGYKVEEVNNNLNEHKGICNSLDTYLWVVNVLDEFEEIVIFEKDIKTILTKEQFEQMSYKIKESR